MNWAGVSRAWSIPLPIFGSVLLLAASWAFFWALTIFGVFSASSPLFIFIMFLVRWRSFLKFFHLKHWAFLRAATLQWWFLLRHTELNLLWVLNHIHLLINGLVLINCDVSSLDFANRWGAHCIIIALTPWQEYRLNFGWLNFNSSLIQRIWQNGRLILVELTTGRIHVN